MNEYKWTMTEDEYKRLQNDLKVGKYTEDVFQDNCYGGVGIGSMFLEFLLCETDERKCELYLNTYEAGNVPLGYGELKNGTPYDCIDTEVYAENLDFTGDFKNFKQSVIKEIERTATDHVRKMMKSDLVVEW